MLALIVVCCFVIAVVMIFLVIAVVIDEINKRKAIDNIFDMVIRNLKYFNECLDKKNVKKEKVK